jgi:hypothetical protein
MTRRFYANGDPGTTLTTGVNASVTSWTVANAGAFPASTPYAVFAEKGTANAEIVLVTAVVGNVLTVTRGYNGSTAVSHGNGVAVQSGVIALDLDDAAAHVAATGDAHGVTGALVGATMVQTLTNKTLTSPAISNPTVTGTTTGANETLSGTLTVTGTTTLGAVTAGAVTPTSVNASGAITAGGALTANGAGTGLAVTNNETVGGTLAVTGAATAASFTANGDGVVSGVVAPKNYTNEAAAGTQPAGDLVYLTAPTGTGFTAGLFMSLGGGTWSPLGKAGQLIQHGTGTFTWTAAAQSATATVTFPTAFPGTPDLSIIAAAITNNTVESASYFSLSSTGFSAISRIDSGATFTGSVGFSWIAIYG